VFAPNYQFLSKDESLTLLQGEARRHQGLAYFASVGDE